MVRQVGHKSKMSKSHHIPGSVKGSLGAQTLPSSAEGSLHDLYNKHVKDSYKSALGTQSLSDKEWSRLQTGEDPKKAFRFMDRSAGEDPSMEAVYGAS